VLKGNHDSDAVNIGCLVIEESMHWNQNNHFVWEGSWIEKIVEKFEENLKRNGNESE